MPAEVHVVGPQICAQGIYRQRCPWCGKLLHESRIRSEFRPGEEVGLLDDVMIRLVGTIAPAETCGLRPLDATR